MDLKVAAFIEEAGLLRDTKYLVFDQTSRFSTTCFFIIFL